MAIQINTDSLTKSHQFIFEACKILWRHKKVFFAFAALPVVLDVVGEVLSERGFLDVAYLGDYPYLTLKYLSPYMIFIAYISTALKWLIALPLFAIGWFRYLLDASFRPTFASYFEINKKVLNWALLSIVFILGKRVLVYVFCLLSFMGAMMGAMKVPSIDSLLRPSLDTINHLFASGGVDVWGVIIYTYKPILIPLFVTVVLSTFVLLYFVAPAFKILPFIALGKPMEVFTLIQHASPYRRSFFIHLICLSFLSLLCFNLADFLHQLIPVTLETSKTYYDLLNGLSKIGVNILNYGICGVTFNVIALYHKRYSSSLEIKMPKTESHSTVESYSSHALLGASRMLWEHRKIFLKLFFFSATSSLMMVTISYLPAYFNIIPKEYIQYSAVLIFLVINTFFSVEWLKTLIEPKYKPTLKSYFKVDKYFPRNLLFNTALSAPSLCLNWILSGGNFCKPYSAAVQWIALSLFLLSYYVLSPWLLAWPASISNRLEDVLKVIKTAFLKPMGFFANIILIMFGGSWIYFCLTLDSGQWYDPIKYIPILHRDLVPIFFRIFNGIINYGITALWLSFIVLYYRKLTVKKEI